MLPYRCHTATLNSCSHKSGSHREQNETPPFLACERLHPASNEVAGRPQAKGDKKKKKAPDGPEMTEAARRRHKSTQWPVPGRRRRGVFWCAILRRPRGGRCVPATPSAYVLVRLTRQLGLSTSTSTPSSMLSTRLPLFTSASEYAMVAFRREYSQHLEQALEEEMGNGQGGQWRGFRVGHRHRWLPVSESLRWGWKPQDVRLKAGR